MHTMLQTDCDQMPKTACETPIPSTFCVIWKMMNCPNLGGQFREAHFIARKIAIHCFFLSFLWMLTRKSEHPADRQLLAETSLSIVSPRPTAS
jgi:hypothetical protein